MTDKTDAIGGIIAIMKSCWDFPADCNEGELFTYAEVLFDQSKRATIMTRSTRISPTCKRINWKCRPPTPTRRSSDRSIALVKTSA